MSEVVFHIGFPKTGTTTLQFAFARNPEVHYLGKNMRDAPVGHSDPRIVPSILLAKKLLTADTARFEDALPEMQQIIEDAISNGKSVFLSDEAFTFAEYMAVGQAYNASATTDHYAMAERLHRLWPTAKILVSLREQRSFLTSWYLQRRKRGAISHSFDEFLSRAKAGLETRSLLHAIKYDEMYQAYANLFDAKNMRVLLFEQFRLDYGLIVSEAAKAAGVDEKSALEIWGNAHNNNREALHPQIRKYLKHLPNGLVDNIPHPLIKAAKSVFPKVKASAKFSDEDAVFLEEFYAQSNANMARLGNVPLGKFGYSIAPDIANESPSK